MNSDFREEIVIGEPNYNHRRARICSSLKWIFSIAAAADGTSKLMINKSSHFLTSEGYLKAEFENLLLSGEVYEKALLYVFHSAPPSTKFEGILQLLCRHGMYVLRYDDCVLTFEQLEAKPINMVAHLHLIDMIMQAATSILWCQIQNVVTKVKLFSEFSASKDLPNDFEEAVVLWLNKVMLKVKRLESPSESSSNKMKLQDRRHFPKVTMKLDDLCDSSVLATLLHYYCPYHIKLENLALKETNSLADTLHNIRFCLRFCNEQFFTGLGACNLTDVLTPDDFVHAHHELRQNFFAFFAYLFFALEMRPFSRTIKPRGHQVVLVNESNSNNVRSDRNNQRLSGTSHLRKEIEAALPEVESLLSDATKRSFLHGSNSHLHKTLTQNPAIKNESLGDAAATQKAATPPLVNPHSRFADVVERNGSDEEPRSAWYNDDNCRVVPFSSRSTTGSEASWSSSTSNSEHPMKKFQERSNIAMTNLLAKVDISGDDLMATGSTIVDDDSSVLASPRDTDPSWPGFVRRDNRNPSPPPYDAGDLTLDTVRTVDSTPRHHSSRFIARPLTNTSDSWSDFTVVTGPSPDDRVLAASGAGGLSLDDVTSSSSSSSSGVVERPSMLTMSDSPEWVKPRSSAGRVHESYVVKSGNFNTVESARAAGYPIIDLHDHDQPSTYQQPTAAHHPQPNQPYSNTTDHHHYQPSPSQGPVANRRPLDRPWQQQPGGEPSRSTSMTSPGVTSSSRVRRSRVTSLQQSPGASIESSIDPEAWKETRANTGVKMRANSSRARRAGKVQSCFVPSTNIRVAGRTGADDNGAVNARFVEISHQLEQLRIEISTLRRAGAKNASAPSTASSCTHVTAKRPSTISSFASSPPRRRNSDDGHVGNHSDVTYASSQRNDVMFQTSQHNDVTFTTSQRHDVPLPAAHRNDVTFAPSPRSNVSYVSSQRGDVTLPTAHHNDVTYVSAQRNDVVSASSLRSPSQLSDVTYVASRASPGIATPPRHPPAATTTAMTSSTQAAAAMTSSSAATTDDVEAIERQLNLLQMSIGRDLHKRDVVRMREHADHVVADARALQPSSRKSPPPEDDETSTRRSLFPDGADSAPPSSKHDTDTAAAAAGAAATERAVVEAAPAHEVSVTYNSFSSRIQRQSEEGGGNSAQSTPAKQHSQTPEEDTIRLEDASLHVECEIEKKAAKGFLILDESSPAKTELDKKKEQFLLSRLRKEEEQRKKQMEREVASLKKKQEAREQEERNAQRKQEEREKREKRLKEYQKRKQDQEKTALNHQKPGIHSNSSSAANCGMGRKTKSKTNLHQADGSEALKNLINFDQNTYDLSVISSGKSSPRTGAGTESNCGDSDIDSIGSAGTSDYAGPKLYKQLSLKSNRPLIRNAISHCCLPAKVNEAVRTKTLQALDQTDAHHLIILFRDNQLKYRALYSFDPENEKLHRITGNGPSLIHPSMIESLFKYNSGRRAFAAIPSKTLSVSIDAITIKNSLWQHAVHKK